MFIVFPNGKKGETYLSKAVEVAVGIVAAGNEDSLAFQE